MRGDTPINELRFIVDHNVGKLAKWLRMMGFDSLFFDGMTPLWFPGLWLKAG